MIEQPVLRNFIEAAIICQPYVSGGSVCESNGVMRDFSSEGCYIETSYKFNIGTILIVRIVSFSTIAPSLTDKAQPRSIGLAEVKWRKELVDDNAFRFGIGLRYLK